MLHPALRTSGLLLLIVKIWPLPEVLQFLLPALGEATHLMVVAPHPRTPFLAVHTGHSILESSAPK